MKSPAKTAIPLRAAIFRRKLLAKPLYARRITAGAGDGSGAGL